MTANPPPPSDTAGLEEPAIQSFRDDGVTFRDGLGFVPGAAFEPRMLPDRHWGQLYNLLNRSPQTLAIGIDIGTALELAQDDPTVFGSRAVVTLDGRYASYGVGGNRALGARYVILDSFVDGDAVWP